MPSWIIVGASRGIGYGYLQTLSKDPANTIVGIVRNVPATLDKVKSDGLQNVHIVHGDMNDYKSLNAASEEVSKLTNGVVDYLIVNGAHLSGPAYFLNPPDLVGREELFLDELNKCMITNVAAMLFAINAFMPQVLKSEIKKVVAISSASGDVDACTKGEVQNGITYGISKAGVNLLVQRFATAYRKQGVIVVAMNPGWVYTITDSLETVPEQVKPMLEEVMVMARKWVPGFKGPVMPADSVPVQVRTIESFTMEQSGQFFSHVGDKKTWV